MLFKFFSASALAFGLALQVQGHAIISPALGVSGTPTRNDVQRPSNNQQCGNVNIAQTIGSTTPIAANADGSFTATVTNFNTGQDGSRQVTAQVDSTATGKTFVAAQVTKNGDLAPTNVGSQQVTVQLPANTKCTGGSGKNECLVSFTTAGGFGNCVVVQQGAAAGGNAAAAGGAAAAAGGAAAAAAAAGGAAASATAAAPAATTTTTGNGKGKGHHHKQGQQAKGQQANNAAAKHNNREIDVRAVGTRAARALRAMEETM